MRRRYEFVATLGLNVLIAYYGTWLLVHLIKQTVNWLGFQPTTISGAVYATITETFLCAFAIGVLIWPLLRMGSAKWVWLPTSIWFIFGVLTYLLGPSDSALFKESLQDHFLALSTGPESLAAFYNYFLPFLSGLAYSLGVFCSQSLHRAPKVEIKSRVART